MPQQHSRTSTQGRWENCRCSLLWGPYRHRLMPVALSVTRCWPWGLLQTIRTSSSRFLRAFNGKFSPAILFPWKENQGKLGHWMRVTEALQSAIYRSACLEGCSGAITAVTWWKAGVALVCAGSRLADAHDRGVCTLGNTVLGGAQTTNSGSLRVLVWVQTCSTWHFLLGRTGV